VSTQLSLLLDRSHRDALNEAELNGKDQMNNKENGWKCEGMKKLNGQGTDDEGN
jgi:hypothetical protein